MKRLTDEHLRAIIGDPTRARHGDCDPVAHIATECLERGRERDEWKARAEAAEARNGELHELAGVSGDADHDDACRAIMQARNAAGLAVARAEAAEKALEVAQIRERHAYDGLAMHSKAEDGALARAEAAEAEARDMRHLIEVAINTGGDPEERIVDLRNDYVDAVKHHHAVDLLTNHPDAPGGLGDE